MLRYGKSISFIILSWNSEKYIANCFDSIISACREEGIKYEIIVIDNGSKDRSLEIINKYSRQQPDSFKKIVLNKNRGTTYTRNLGLKKASGGYICILDSDTEIREGSLSKLLGTLDGDKRIGMIVPKLILNDGSVQNSVKKFPVFWHKISKLPTTFFNIKVRNFDFYENFPFESETPVDSAISACWFFKRDLLFQVGLLDENIFYAPEDLDYCLRVWNAGKKILYYPKVIILHHTQQISHKKPLSKTAISHFFGLLYYYRKHGGWFTKCKRVGKEN